MKMCKDCYYRKQIHFDTKLSHLLDWYCNNPIDILLYAEGKWKYYFEFDNDGFEDDDFEDPITAWMPLPEPYQSEEGQE